MKSSLHILIPFLPFLLNHLRLPSLSFLLQLPTPELDSIQFLCSYPGRLVSRNSTQMIFCHFYNPSAWTTQTTHPLYFWKGVFTAQLHRSGSYSIVACVFVAAGMCLSNSCLAMDVCSDFTISAFGCHVTISTYMSGAMSHTLKTTLGFTEQ
jgi:hypothetical protein